MKSILSPSHPDFIGTSSWLGYGYLLNKRFKNVISSLAQHFTQNKTNSLARLFILDNIASIAQSFTTGNKRTTIPIQGIHALIKG